MFLMLVKSFNARNACTLVRVVLLMINDNWIANNNVHEKDTFNDRSACTLVRVVLLMINDNWIANNNVHEKDTFNDRSACTLVRVGLKATIGEIVTPSAQLGSVGLMTSNHDDDDDN